MAEYVIYADESDQTGPFFSNFYGGALVASTELSTVERLLNEKKKMLNLYGEIKWSKVTENYLAKYEEMMALFFDLIASGQVKIRIMFTQNAVVAHNLQERHVRQRYFILYYQFLKHAFGLAHCNPAGEPVYLRLYLDRIPDTAEQIQQFKDFLIALNRNSQFRRSQVVLRRDQIAEVESHNHVIMQCLDIVLGAIQFRLNNKHLQKPSGGKRRGKKTIAKEKLYRFICQRIRSIRPNFNIGITTGGGAADRWTQPYRHWKFTPRNSTFDATKTKPKK